MICISEGKAFISELFTSYWSKNVPFFPHENACPQNWKKKTFLALVCHLSISSQRSCTLHFQCKRCWWRKWALWAVELHWDSVDKVEGKEVEDSAPAQGPDRPLPLTGRGLLLLWQCWSPGAFYELPAGRQSCAALAEFESEVDV